MLGLFFCHAYICPANGGKPGGGAGPQMSAARARPRVCRALAKTNAAPGSARSGAMRRCLRSHAQPHRQHLRSAPRAAVLLNRTWPQPAVRGCTARATVRASAPRYGRSCSAGRAGCSRDAPAGLPPALFALAVGAACGDGGNVNVRWPMPRNRTANTSS